MAVSQTTTCITVGHRTVKVMDTLRANLHIIITAIHPRATIPTLSHLCTIILHINKANIVIKANRLNRVCHTISQGRQDSSAIHRFTLAIRHLNVVGLRHEVEEVILLIYPGLQAMV